MKPIRNRSINFISSTLSKIFFKSAPCSIFLFIATNFSNEMETIKENILLYQVNCPNCGALNTWNLKGKSIRCTRSNCRKYYSILHGSFFLNSKIDINKIMFIAYYWILGVPVTSTIETLEISNQTVWDYYSFFENMVVDEISDYIHKIEGKTSLSK